jgi:NADPH:quinone reductase-like Zn-dependent oxidoreductase
VVSDTTTAVVAEGYGGPEVLSLIETPVALPGAGEVRISVHAAGTNPVDFKAYSGAFGRDPARLPIRLGREAAGIVTAVGDGAEGPAGPVAVGDEVVVYPAEGAYAADVVVPGSSVVPKPSTLSYREAGGLLVAGVTAVHALTVTGVGPRDTVLVHGALGGVGLMAVQLALVAGARVIGTARSGGHAELRALGADPVAYGDGLVERVRALAPEGVDVAIDTVGTDEALDASIALVSDHDRIATIAAFRRGLELGVKVIGGAPGADPGTAIRSAARLELVRLAGEGRIRVVVAAAYPLAEAAAAHRALADGHTHGKIVLTP